MSADLVAFLRARLDEQAARSWAIHDVGKCDALLYEEDMAAAAEADPDCDCGLPARVLAELDAKRRIIDRYADARDDAASPGWAGGQAYALERVVELLTLPYADHPDYRPDYRPEWAAEAAGE